MMTQVRSFSRVFEGTAQVRLPDIFPPFLAERGPQASWRGGVRRLDVQEQFANALATMMIGSLGHCRRAKINCPWGTAPRPGTWIRLWKGCAAAIPENSLVITRNNESRKILRELGVRTELGTDTAWTFEPLGAEYGRKALRAVGLGREDAGAGGVSHQSVRVAGASVVAKLLLHSLTGAYKESHYRRTLIFITSGPAADQGTTSTT